MKLSDMLSLEQKRKLYAMAREHNISPPTIRHDKAKKKKQDENINYKELMRHRAYRRRGGAIKQIRY